MELKNSIKEVGIEYASLGNRANKKEERFSEIEDKNLEMIQMEEEEDLRI